MPRSTTACTPTKHVHRNVSPIHHTAAGMVYHQRGYSIAAQRDWVPEAYRTGTTWGKVARVISWFGGNRQRRSS